MHITHVGMWTVWSGSVSVKKLRFWDENELNWKTSQYWLCTFSPEKIVSGVKFQRFFPKKCFRRFDYNVFSWKKSFEWFNFNKFLFKKKGLKKYKTVFIVC